MVSSVPRTSVRTRTCSSRSGAEAGLRSASSSKPRTAQSPRSLSKRNFSVAYKSSYDVLMDGPGIYDGACSAVFKFTPTGTDLAEWYSLGVENAFGWANEGWGGHTYVCVSFPRDRFVACMVRMYS